MRLNIVAPHRGHPMLSIKNDGFVVGLRLEVNEPARKDIVSYIGDGFWNGRIRTSRHSCDTDISATVSFLNKKEKLNQGIS